MVNYTETSIKVTPTEIHTGRRSLGFFPDEVASVPDFIRECVGPEKFEIFLKYFSKEIMEPVPSRLLMIGTDGTDWEFYVEYGDSGASYDAGRDMDFTYHRVPREQYGFVYGYLERAMKPEIFEALFEPAECSHVWIKNSPNHKFVYLFKHKEGVPLVKMREVLQKAAGAINPVKIELDPDDSKFVSILALGVTSTGQPQLSIYLRPTSSSALATSEG